MTKPEIVITVEPINEHLERQVQTSTAECIALAGRIYDQAFPLIPVRFDLNGRAAGMYRVRDNNREIRYNPYIFARYFDDNLATTVPHEVAHYVVDLLYGAARVRPHGIEWQQVMLALGAEPSVTGRYDLSGMPVRRQKRYDYRCACMTHQISTARHNKILRGSAHYHCRKCKSVIKLATDQK